MRYNKYRVAIIIPVIIVIHMYYYLNNFSNSNNSSKNTLIVLEPQELVFEAYTPSNITPKEYYNKKLDEVYKEIARMKVSNPSPEEKKYLDKLFFLRIKYQILVDPQVIGL